MIWRILHKPIQQQQQQQLPMQHRYLHNPRMLLLLLSNKKTIFLSKVTVIFKNNFRKSCSKLTWKNSSYFSCNNSKDNSNWNKQQINNQTLLKLVQSNNLLSNNQQSQLCLNQTTKLCQLAIMRKLLALIVDLNNIFMIVITTKVQELTTTIIITPITMDSAKVNHFAVILPGNITTWVLS